MADRAAQVARGLTFEELAERLGVEPALRREWLASVIRLELRAGRIVYDVSSRRFELNGHLPADVRQAFRDL